ncbi:hypothetical protein BaRGS_00008593 [Batillaria attramentaria]|uniref:Uncharacterized protein n=1 Tax=Batillaria attramentaria TaxID=370345 RepID=A0ABD0LLD4_9CAEN
MPSPNKYLLRSQSPQRRCRLEMGRGFYSSPQWSPLVVPLPKTFAIQRDVSALSLARADSLVILSLLELPRQ